MGEPLRFSRAVRWEELDTAGFAYFPRIVAIAHEAMERIFERAGGPRRYAEFLAGGHGLPCVRVETDFRAPLRFGDVVEVEASVVKLGRSSVEFDVRIARDGGVECARIRYVVACTDLRIPASVPLPDDVRAIMAAHRVAGG